MRPPLPHTHLTSLADDLDHAMYRRCPSRLATVAHGLVAARTDPSLQEMQELCEQPGRYAQFVACSSDDEAQGLVEVALRSDYVNGTASSPVGFLEGLYVAPAYRKRGIAAELVRTAEQWVRSQGCKEFASDALLDNTASQVMHLALGFEETERVVYFRKLL